MNEPQQPLYDKLGGQETVTAVVESFYKKILADDTVNKFFANTDIEKQVRHQTAFISMALGGPQFTGRSMEKAHQGLNLQEEHWNAVVNHLVNTLIEFNVSEEDITVIAGALMPLKPAILGN